MKNKEHCLEMCQKIISQLKTVFEESTLGDIEQNIIPEIEELKDSIEKLL